VQVQPAVGRVKEVGVQREDETVERNLSGIAAETADLARDLACQANAYKDLAYTDALSGLPNRRAFEDRAARLRDFSGAKPLAVLMMDLDGFKQVNDLEGHEAGDRILASMARAIAGAFARATSSLASVAMSLRPCCLAPIWRRRRAWRSDCGQACRTPAPALQSLPASALPCWRTMSGERCCELM
jgi:hypothetical protein